jgi:isoquinoline 1-oxidoreductase alpha subunit
MKAGRPVGAKPLSSSLLEDILSKLVINDGIKTIDVEPDMPLLHVLREKLDLTGTKFGCGVGVCGACTVLADGKAIRSCITPVRAVEGKEITTIEGLAKNGELSGIQKAWIEEQVPQCGYCQPGMIMAATALLQRNPSPTDGDIDASITNICRCGTYPRIRRAIQKAAKS